MSIYSTKRFMFMTILVSTLIYSCDSQTSQPESSTDDSSSSIIMMSSSENNSSSSVLANLQNCEYIVVSDRSGLLTCHEKEYKTITVGVNDSMQVWLAENLAWLPVVNKEIDVSKTETKYYVYGNSNESVGDATLDSNYSTYGVLYNYLAALNACPIGWSLPNDDDWKILFENIGGVDSAGIILKSNSLWIDEGANGNNKIGFSALPGGYVNADYVIMGYSFMKLNEYGAWWTSTSNGSSVGNAAYMISDAANVGRWINVSRSNGMSVRCIKKNNI